MRRTSPGALIIGGLCLLLVALSNESSAPFMTHGMPDEAVVWDILNPPIKAGRLRHVPCTSCSMMYSITASVCPGCGEHNELLLMRGASPTLRRVIERLDMTVVEQERQKIAREALEKRMSTEIIMPFFSDAGPIGKALTAVRQWYCNALIESGIQVIEVNQFFNSKEARTIDWWTQRFTFADSASNNHKKALKEYKKWLKSN
jgi:hypothetical protein